MAMAIWIVSCIVFVSGLTLVLVGAIKLHVARQEKEVLTRTLAGRWTWDLALSKGGSPTITINLWPKDRLATEVLNVARGIEVAADNQGKVMQHCPAGEEGGLKSREYFRVVFINRLSSDVIPAGHRR